MLRRAIFIPFAESCRKASKDEVFGPMVQIILVFRIVIKVKDEGALVIERWLKCKKNVPKQSKSSW
jgi:hypothetical protein